MAGEGATTRLDFGTNVQSVVSTIVGELGRLDRALVGTSTAGERTNIGGQMVASLEQLPAAAQRAALQVREAFAGALSGGAAPGKTLGWNFQQLIGEARAAGEQIAATLTSTQREALGGERAIKEQLAAPIRALLLQLREVHAQIAASFRDMEASGLAVPPQWRRLINPNTTGRAVAAGERAVGDILGSPLPAYDAGAAERLTAGLGGVGGVAKKAEIDIRKITGALDQFADRGVIDVARVKDAIAQLQAEAARLRLQAVGLDKEVAAPFLAEATEHQNKARALQTSLAATQTKGRVDVLGGAEGAVGVNVAERIAQVEALITEGRTAEASATASVARAEIELNTVRRAGLAGSEQELVAIDRLTTAEARLAAATQKAERAQVAQAQAQTRAFAPVAAAAPAHKEQGILGSFLGGAFGRGYQAGQDFDPSHAVQNLAGTVGVLARYGGAGVAIAGIFTALAEVKTQYLDYGVSLSNLADIQGAVANGQIDINEAVKAGVPAGEGGAAAVNTATEALARYANEIHSADDANRIAVESVRQVGQAMVLTGLDAQTAGERIFDATQGFDLGSGGQQRILDAVVNARHNFGGDRAQILLAVADAADLASSAGIDPEQLANIVALIQARTGSTANAVASAFERTVSRSGTSQFRSALSSLGVQDTGDLVTEITELSAKYQTLTKVQQQQLVSSLGGARQAKELLPLLQEGTHLIDANSESYNGAGAAAELYAKQQATLAGQLRQVSGELRDIALQLAQSGLLDVFGLSIEALRPFLAGVDELLRLFNSLPHAVRTTYAAILELALIGRLAGGRGIIGGVVGNVFGKVPGVNRILGTGGVEKAEKVTAEQEAARITIGAAETVSRINIATAEQVATILRAGAGVAAEEQAAAGFAPLGFSAKKLPGGKFASSGLEGGGALIGAEMAGAFGTARAGIAAVGSGLVGLLTSPVTWAIAGLIAIGGVKSSMDHLSAAAEQGALGLMQLSGARSVDDLRTAASTLQASIAAHDRARHEGPFGLFGAVGAFFSPAAGEQNKQDKRALSYAQQQIKEQSAVDTTAKSAIGQASTFFGASGHDVAAGLAAMSQAGYPAEVQLRAVAAALGILHVSAGSLLGGFRAPTAPSGLIANPFTSQAIVGFGQGALTGPDIHYNKDNPHSPLFSDHTGHWGLVNFTPPDPNKTKKIVADELAKNQVPDGGVIPQDVQDQIINDIIDSYNIKGSKKDVERFKVLLRTKLTGELKGLTAGGLTSTSGPLSDNDLRTNLLGTFDAKGNQTSTGYLATLQAYTPNPLDIKGGESDYAIQLATLRSWAARATDKTGPYYLTLIDSINKVEAQYIQVRVANLERFRRAADAKNAGNLAGIQRVDTAAFSAEVKTASDSIPALVQILSQVTDAQVEYFLAEARGNVRVAAAAVERDRRLRVLIRSLSPEDRSSLKDSATKDQAALDAANNALHNIQAAADLSAADRAQAEQARVIAHMQARARPGDDLSQAQTAIDVARYQMAHATKPEDYDNALKALNDAEYQYAQTKASIAEAIVQSKVFPGSQLDAARAQIDVARIALNAAVPGTQAYYNALGQLNQAQVSYANALVEYHANQRLLTIDLTDPVATAQAELAHAREQLSSDQKQHAPADVIAADRVKVLQDQYSAQKASFDQQLQYEQTLYGLHQISGSAYKKFLTGQQSALKSQLATMKKGTQGYQQTLDELLQVQQALQGLNEQAQGQFNIGDIRIPTPYEARRYVTQSARGQNYQTGPTTTTTYNQQHFNFAGVDKSEVEAILREVLGADTTTRSGTVTRKV